MIHRLVKKICTKISNKRQAMSQRRLFKVQVGKLLKTEFIVPGALHYIWQVDKVSDEIQANEITIFGRKIDTKKIDWHKDYVSGFCYPLKRIDDLRISKWFDKGIDVKFPWELSRFQFAVNWAAAYRIDGNRQRYLLFKRLVLDWLAQNPFLFGVNWVCTMEVALRSVSWIVALNLFREEFDQDVEFKSALLYSLVQHAEYIHAFPEIYENGHTTNHTTADYVGLLFLALTLQDHPQASIWREQAVQGLVHCMEYQVYEDGVSFEGSTSYHRLVLEMFAYAAVLCRANQIDLPRSYYCKLFRMFEFSAACMDHNGNVPLIGDDDSGRLLPFEGYPNNNHAYLLKLGQQLFEHQFYSQCTIKTAKTPLPTFPAVALLPLNINPRDTTQSISFPNGGFYFLKNDHFSVLLSIVPLGQNGNGGHNHYDVGSYTISLDGIPIICDPGSYTYTRNRNKRDLFRSFFYHNTLVPQKNVMLPKIQNDYWRLRKRFDVEILSRSNSIIEIQIQDILDAKKWRRKLVLKKNLLEIFDYFDGLFNIRIHLSPEFKIRNDEPFSFKMDHFKLNFSNATFIEIANYFHSSQYDSLEMAPMINAEADHCLSYNIECSI